MKRDSGRVVLITGCSTGIGRALAEEFLERGDRVATNFPEAAGRGLDRYRDPTSLYNDRIEAMEERAGMSKNLAMSAAEFTRRVADAATRKNPPAMLKIGGGARIVPAMAMLPKKLLAKLLGRKFGLG